MPHSKPIASMFTGYLASIETYTTEHCDSFLSVSRVIRLFKARSLLRPGFDWL